MKSLLRFPALLLAAGVCRSAVFTPDAAVRHALLHQPDLAAARLTVEEARGRRAQAGRLANPELETEVRPNINGREGIVAAGLTQRFPLTARLRAERAVSESGIAAAEAEVLEAERQAAARAALAVADWIALAARLALNERQVANARSFAEALQAAAGRGEVPELDARQLRLEAGQTALQRRRMEQERAALRGELGRLLNLPSGEPLELDGALPSGAAWNPSLPGDGSGVRPEVRIAEARLETARHELEVARAHRWQDAGVGLVSELQRSEDEPAGMQRDGFVGLRMTLPLPLWNRNEGRIRETSALVQRRDRELDAARLRVRSEQDAARETLALAAATERAWREEQLPLAREVEEEMERLRAGGQAPFADWARARERRLLAEAGLLGAQADLLRAWLAALTALGHPPRFPEQP